MSKGKKAIKKSEANAAKGSKSRAVRASDRSRHERQLVRGRKTRG